MAHRADFRGGVLAVVTGAVKLLPGFWNGDSFQIMNMPRKSNGWVGLPAVACGLFVITYLMITERSVSDWISPTGIVALLMVAAGFWFIIRRVKFQNDED